MGKMNVMKRVPEIIAILMKHGFTGYLKELGLAEKIPFHKRTLPPEDEQLSVKGEELRRAFEELGPTFMKFGQFLSTRTDLLSPGWTEPLAKLQSEAPFIDFEQIKEIIESEMEQPLSELFVYMDEAPLGAASIGQVHRAVLVTGESVAVKVRRPHVERVIHQDIRILRQLAAVAEKNSETARIFSVKETIKDFSASLLNEMNYRLEAAEALSVKEQMENEQIHIPDVYLDYTTERILTMEYVEGKKLTTEHIEELDQVTRQTLAVALAESVLEQVYIKGVFHADPHPGNVVLLPDDRLALIDFGNTGRLTKPMKQLLADCLFSLNDRDSASLSIAVQSLGHSREVNSQALERDLDKWMNQYLDRKLEEVKMGTMFQQLFGLAAVHGIRVPKEFIQVGQAFLKVEQTISALDPAVSFSRIIKDTANRLMLDQLDPKRLFKEARSFTRQIKMAASRLPGIMNETLQQWEGGQPKMQIRIDPDESMMKRVERIAYMLVLSIMMLAFSIIMAGIFIGMKVSGDSSPLSNTNSYQIAIYTAILMTILFSVTIYLMWRKKR